MLIDRDDDVINLCEIKYTSTPWEMQAKDFQDILRKEEVFKFESKTRKTIHNILVSANGVKRNEYSDEIPKIVTADDLFR